MTERVLIHVQHLLGTGHLRRAAALGAALAEVGFDVEIASGGPPIAGLDAGRSRLFQLPPLRTADASFKTLIDAAGNAVDDDWKRRRRDLLLSRFAAFRPDVLVTELFPFGRRVLEFELVPLLDAARTRRDRPLILCSLRDVLVAPRDIGKVETAIARARDWYDRILVHGDPALIDLPASYPAAQTIADRITYTGYVDSPPVPGAASDDGNDEIIVSAGGGAVGARLLETAVEAKAGGAGAGRIWRLLVGADTPAAIRHRLEAHRAPDLIVEPARRDFRTLLRRCHVSVSQAGYNTVMDLLETRARAVLVPFATGGETEQAQRAQALAAKGWALVMPADRLDAANLAAAIEQAGRAPAPDAAGLNRDGAAMTARLVRTLLSSRLP